MMKTIHRAVTIKATLIIALIIAVLVGCQSIGGLNLNKALISNLTVQSAEGNLSLSIQLDIDDNYIDESDALAAKLISSIQIDIDQMKMQDSETFSASGTLHIYKGEIPFSVSLNEDNLVVLVDGVDHPVVIDMGMTDSTSLTEDFGFMFEGLEFDLGMDLGSLFEDKEQELSEALGTYIFNNLVNPNTIQVDRETLTINGQQLNLQKLHTEIYGDEIIDLVRKSIDNFAADEKGLRTLMNTLYDVAQPNLELLIEEIIADPYYDPYTSGLQAAYLDNKTLVVEYLYTTLNHILKQLVVDFDEMIEFFEAEAGLESVFTRDNYLKTDLYFDQSMLIRKFNFDFQFTPPAEQFEGLKRIKVTFGGEQWNLNGDVQADTIPTNQYYFLNEESHPMEILSWFNEDSIAYSLLKDDFGITQVNSYFELVDKEEAYWYDAYKKDRQTMIPVRDLAYDMGYEVSWDAAIKSTTIYDPYTRNTLTVQAGSDMAYLNDELKNMLTKAEIHNGTLYVPLPIILEAFELKKDWDSVFEEVIIIRD